MPDEWGRVQALMELPSLSEVAWRERRAAHESRVRPWIEPRLARRSRGESHPVEDFLFEYYAHQPSHLLRWHPGIGTALTGDGAHEFLLQPMYREMPAGVTVDPAALPAARRPGLRWMHDLLARTLDRPAFFGCFGLHEWAMVYRASEVRHSVWPLRLPAGELADFVESQPLTCSHFDAFRFFTPEARPLNRLQPERTTQSEMEQPGCLHANMDLYKWAMKLQPFTPSELAADCFALAREIRELDMRASPYDLRSLGFAPVPIEDRAGRDEYETAQRGFAARAQPLRKRLRQVAEDVLAGQSLA